MPIITMTIVIDKPFAIAITNLHLVGTGMHALFKSLVGDRSTELRTADLKQVGLPSKD